MISLREDQDYDVKRLRGAFAAGYHAPLLVRATGTGKTYIFSYIAAGLAKNGKRAIAMCHRDELLDQISESFSNFDIRHSFIASDRLYDRRHLVHVASVATAARRLDRVAVPDYVIVDEAHHAVGASMYAKCINHWRAMNPALRIIGVTATPERLSGEGLGETFDEMIVGVQTAEGIEKGILSPFRLFAPAGAGVDMSGVRTRMGDFVRGEAAAVMDKPAIIGSAVNEYRQKMDGAPAVAFCVSVEHAEHVAEQFRAQGYRAAKLDGNMDRGMRRALVNDFSRGAINVLTSCDVLSEGFDVKGIVGAILLRPTQSLALYLQQVGRALRVAPGKDAAIILDHVRNCERHGLPDDPREWSLLGRGERKKKGEKDENACRQCEHCKAYSPAAASKCRECGKAFPVQARKIEEVAGSLSEVEIARMRRVAAREQAAAKTLEELIAVGMARGMKNPHGWARHVHEARMAKQQRAG